MKAKDEEKAGNCRLRIADCGWEKSLIPESAFPNPAIGYHK
jgi:hypothetical protein